MKPFKVKRSGEVEDRETGEVVGNVSDFPDLDRGAAAEAVWGSKSSGVRSYPGGWRRA